MDVHNTLSFVVVVFSSIIVVGTLARYLKKTNRNKELCVRHDKASGENTSLIISKIAIEREHFLVAGIFNVLIKFAKVTFS